MRLGVILGSFPWMQMHWFSLNLARTQFGYATDPPDRRTVFRIPKGGFSERWRSFSSTSQAHWESSGFDAGGFPIRPAVEVPAGYPWQVASKAEPASVSPSPADRIVFVSIIVKLFSSLIFQITFRPGFFAVAVWPCGLLVRPRARALYACLYVPASLRLAGLPRAASTTRRGRLLRLACPTRPQRRPARGHSTVKCSRIGRTEGS